MSGDATVVAAIFGATVVLAVIMWGVFSVGRVAVATEAVKSQQALAEELAETQRQLVEGQKEAAAVLAELRGTVGRIETLLKEVG